MIITQEGQKIAEVLEKLTTSVLLIARRVDAQTVGLDDTIRDLDHLKGDIEKTWGLSTKP
jgi:hypothetical protein